MAAFLALLPVVQASGAETNQGPVLVRARGIEIRTDEWTRRVRALGVAFTNEVKVIRPGAWDQFRAIALEQLLFTRLAAARATEADKKRATFESGAFVAGLQHQFGSNESFQSHLRSLGYGDDDFRRQKLEEALATAVIDREVRASVHLPEADLRRYYDENPARWEQPERYRVAQLMLRGRDDAGQPVPPARREEQRRQLQEWRRQVLGGTNFAELIRLHSEDPGSRDRGGELTFVPGEIGGDFETAARTLVPGAISDVITTPAGQHLLVLRERLPVQRLTYDAVRDDIRQLLVQREMELRIPEFADRVRRDGAVEILGTP